MTVATTTSAAPGSYSITVTGTGSAAAHTASYTLTVNGTGGCASPGQKLGNPGFETRNDPVDRVRPASSVLTPATDRRAPVPGTRGSTATARPTPTPCPSR